MTKTEEIRVIISAYTKGYKKEIDSALREARGFTKNAQGELEASTATWKKYRAAVVREAEAATRGVKKEQEKMRALRDRVSNAATQRADAIAEYGVREGWTDRGIADEIKKEGLGAAVADSDRAAKAYAKARERLAAYTQQASEAKEALGGLNEKIRESQAAADAEKARAKAALENAKAQAKVQKERERATMGVRRFGLTAMGAMLGARTLYLALRKMVTAISSAMMANAGLNKGLREIKGNLSIAFQGIFQAVLPALQQLVSWLSAATNWLAQFIGALTGVSWSKAKKGAQDYGKAISGAGKAAKGSLAAFDELNVLTQQDEAGGASGIDTTPIFGNPESFDFSWLDRIKEKVPVETIERFNQAIKHLKEAWDNLKDNPAVKKILNFVESIIALGATIVLETLAESIETLASALELLDAILQGDWITAFGKYVDTMERLAKIIKAPFKAVGEWLGDILDTTGVSETGQEAFSLIGNACWDGFLNGLTQGAWGITKNWVLPLINWVKEKLGIHSPSTVFEEIGVLCVDGLIKGLKESWTAKIKNWWETSVKPWFTKEKWISIMGGIKASFEDAFKNAANSAIRRVNSMIDKINKALNFSWREFTFLGKQIWSGGSIQLATLPHVPELATGGIVQSDTLARIGENGREAVLPLDRNTGWMERLAGMIGGGDNRDVLLELRTLNQLARALLEKESRPVFAPSADAGRWIDRSAAMYELARG